jgi:nitrite reductase/ring-hydroxylating ferredoxin subunit
MTPFSGDGRAYGRPQGVSDPELVEVDAGTPAGELLRRYWHPFARSADVSMLPVMVRILGEDLVAFRDLDGRIGLLEPRCCHRGASLYYGRVEANGLRCCYHGWLFATDGRCLDQPCEPDRGRNRDSHRQPWYPVREYNGLLFAYLGPADRQPALPRYDIFEDLGDDEEIVIIDHFAFGGPNEAACNWFQTHENSADPYHVFILHNTHSGAQFDRRLAIYPRITWTRHEWGVTTCQDRDLPDGTMLHRVTEVRVPTLRVIPDPTLSALGTTNNVAWAVPLDATHTKVYCMLRKRVDEPAPGSATYGEDGRSWHELTEAEHQQYPGDYEAQVGQGPITLHSTERLASTDRGVGLVRRQFKEQVRIVAEGGDPVGLSFDEDDALVHLIAGNYIVGPDVDSSAIPLWAGT